MDLHKIALHLDAFNPIEGDIQELVDALNTSHQAELLEAQDEG